MAYNSPTKDDRTSSYFPPNSCNRSYDRSSSYFSPNSSNRLYFSDQAIRSGYRVPVDSREPESQRYPNDLRDPVEREREKDRIRAEIMAEQMERRRILEEEVRMELMVEREMTLKRWESSRMRSDASSEIREFVHGHSGLRYDAPEIRDFVHESSRLGFNTAPEIRQSIHEPSTSRRRFDASFETLQYVHEPSRIPQPSGHLEERRLPLVSSHPLAGVGIFGSFKHHLMPPTTSNLSLRETKPLPPATSNLVLRDIKPLQELGKERILLAKREANVSDPNRKRKASALGADHHRPGNLEKKPKGGWSCKLCNISTTSEKTLLDHLKGKKHKLMEEEEGLAPYKTGSNSNPVKEELSHKPGPCHPNVNKTTKTNSSETSRADITMMDKKQKSKMNVTPRPEASPMVDKKQKASATMVDKKQMSKMNGSVKTQGPSKTTGNAGSVKKFKFWCELCQVGVNSETVLAGHQKGRRHLENLEEEKKRKSEALKRDVLSIF